MTTKIEEGDLVKMAVYQIMDRKWKDEIWYVDRMEEHKALGLLVFLLSTERPRPKALGYKIEHVTLYKKATTDAERVMHRLMVP